jgi:hypothetical protein
MRGIGILVAIFLRTRVSSSPLIVFRREDIPVSIGIIIGTHLTASTK